MGKRELQTEDDDPSPPRMVSVFLMEHTGFGFAGIHKRALNTWLEVNFPELNKTYNAAAAHGGRGFSEKMATFAGTYRRNTLPRGDSSQDVRTLPDEKNWDEVARIRASSLDVKQFWKQREWRGAHSRLEVRHFIKV